MRILFILASDNIYRYKNIFTINNGFAPLSLTTIAASVPKKYNAEIRIIDEGMQSVNYDKMSFDIVGISCCASSANRAYELAEYWKKRGTYTLIGGYHATLLPDDALKHCDSVLCGFGEYVFPEFLEDYSAGKTKKIYISDCEKDMKTVLPNRDLIKNIPYYAKNTMYATRGCTNNCSFCSVNKFTSSRYIKRPVNEIVDEIKENNFKTVYFMDSNFTMEHEYTKELLEALLPLNISYYADVTADAYLDTELVELLQKSGCFQVFIGFETLNHTSVNTSNLKTKILNNYKECAGSFHDKNISITGGFMVGMPGDSEEYIKNLPNYVQELGVDLIRYTIFTPLPGTSIYNEFKQKDKLLTYNYDYYDFMHVVHKPELLSAHKLQFLYSDIWKKTYSYKRIIRRVNKVKNKKTDMLLQNLYFKLLSNRVPEQIPYKY